MNYVLQFIHIENPEQQGFLIPNFKNSPVNSDEICDINCDWGREWYISHFPFLERTKNDK